MKSPKTKKTSIVILCLLTFQSIFSQHIVENRRDYIKKLETNKKNINYDRNAIIPPKEVVITKKKQQKKQVFFLAKKNRVRNKFKKTSPALALRNQVNKQEVKNTVVLDNVAKELESKNVIAAVEKVKEKITTLKVHHVIEEEVEALEKNITEKRLDKRKLLEPVVAAKRKRKIPNANKTITVANVEVSNHNEITEEHLEEMLATRRFLKHRNNTMLDTNKCFIDKDTHDDEEQVCETK